MDTEIIRADPTQTGCWIDGISGQYIYRNLLQVATSMGYPVSQEEITAFDHDVFDSNVSNDVLASVDVITEWMNENIAPDGYQFGFYEGEYFFQSEAWWEGDDESSEYGDHRLVCLPPEQPVCADCRQAGVRYELGDWAGTVRDRHNSLVLMASEYGDHRLVCLSCEGKRAHSVTLGSHELVCADCGRVGTRYQLGDWTDWVGNVHDRHNSLVLMASEEYSQLLCLPCAGRRARNRQRDTE
ncbi:MAG: hypothetical protein ACREBW_06600 [Candidatus Micrarchaeaceae archaeon]